MTGVRLWRTVKLFQDEMFLIGVAFLILILQTALGFYIPQLTRVFQEATSVLLPSPPRIHWLSINFCLFILSCRFCAQGFKDVVQRQQSGQCNYGNLFPNQSVCVAAFNVGDLESRKAFAPLLNGILYPTTCSDSNPRDANSQCTCSGVQSDSPIRVRFLSLNRMQALLSLVASVPRHVSQLSTPRYVSVF